MRAPDFGDMVTGTVADENDWTNSGPKITRPRRIARGRVIGLFSDTPTACKVETSTGEVLCIRLDIRTSKTSRNRTA